MSNLKFRAVANPEKTLLALAVILFFISYSVFYFCRCLWIEAVVFLLLAALFFGVLYFYGSIVTVSKEGVKVSFLRRTRFQLQWQDIQEIGVLGNRVFLRGNSKRHGRLYIYFSKEKMTEQERFQMAVKWPPRKIAFTVFTEEKITVIQSIWPSKIALYNVGDLEL